ncbi:beta-1,6-N-acetylglucosaminyltransferase [Leptolyngbya sp. BL0902]|uniref:beta-1,6-N-acetylglucosaminyltransferase n=1 Tax=Leptolyngbya sp. BL0902 TaxID=1115757 RepID=UPI0018E8743B|nr:beta-1,6-N-acetylglucosaminyltransferase [Leptolyngbya sp. BL0902]
MATSLGFILVTHNQPNQLRRLVDTINIMFDYPRIVCHHNFSITPLNQESFPKNVKFVMPHVKTKWGKFSTIEAEMRALRLLYQCPDPPDWFTILSGSDYPIKPAAKIIQDLSSSPYDAFIHHEIVQYNRLESPWQRLGYQRYCTVKTWVPAIEKNGRLKKKFITLLEKPSLTKFFTPFSDSFPCFVGDHFFCGNHRVAKYLLDQHETAVSLQKYYQKHTIFPTESYYQTLLCNARGFNLCNNNMRYVDWSSENAHPKTLGMEDLPSLLSSSAHFARKFDSCKDIEILNELDKQIREY